VKIATLWNNDEIERFFTSSSDPYMGHAPKLLPILPGKRHKGWFLRKPV
jgi:hypothetical protein